MIAINCDDCDYRHAGVSIPKRARKLAQAHCETQRHTVRIIADNLHVDVYTPQNHVLRL